MEREFSATSKTPTRKIVARVATILLTIALLESLSWAWLRSAGWYDSWSYLTISDRELWIALRPGIRARLRGVDIAIDRSGLRDASTEATVEPKREGEF